VKAIEPGAPITVDPALIRALEIDKETYEFIYASTYLPSWLWAPTEGMRWLLDSPDYPAPLVAEAFTSIVTPSSL
jgi:predicted trehalose synthase